MLIKILKKLITLVKIAFNNDYFFKLSRSQNNNEENLYLEYLSNFVRNKYFIEIGFHHLEFNCISLIKKNFSGLMIDGGRKTNIFLLKIIIFFLKKNINIKNSFIKVSNIVNIISNKKIGILSIDIDGNDYWILKEILKNNIFPEIIITEYNASFLDKAISIPYEENFSRKLKHSSGFYHGASLKAFYKLMKKFNYHLVKSIGGANIIFVNNEIKNKFNLNSFSHEEVYQECYLRNKWSKTNAEMQFEIIKHLEFIDV